MSRTRIWMTETSNKPFVVQPKIIELDMGGWEGFAHVELIDSNTGQILEVRDCKNVITDRWLDVIGIGVSSFVASGVGGVAALALGTGSVTLGGISAHTSSLFAEPTASFRAGGASGFPGSGSWVASGSYWRYVITFLFNESQSNGTITELGLSDTLTSLAPVWTHAPMTDITGTIAPLIKTSAQQLRITYEVRFFPPTELRSGSIVMNGVSSSYFIGPNSIADDRVWGTNGVFSAGYSNNNHLVLLQTASIPAISGGVWTISGVGNQDDIGNGTFGYYMTGSFQPSNYKLGTFFIDSLYDAEPTDAIFVGGIGGFVANVNSPWACQFSPSIQKTNIQRMTLILRRSWYRIADSQ
jgi:hypothetical protein